MALAYAFSTFSAEHGLQANPGDIIFLSTGRKGRSASLDLLEQKERALRWGKGTPQRIIIPLSEHRPNLDDMLGAAMLRLWSAKKLAPEELRSFAEYAANARHGLCFPSLSLVRSLQGIFLAIRALAWRDDPERQSREAANAFLTRWFAVERVIVKAARAGSTPHTTALFDGPGFLPERAFLARDRAAFRDDLERGRLWVLPDGRCGMLLREPRSQLPRHWLRCEARASRDGRFAFLACHQQGRWTVESDPLGSLPLQTLHEYLRRSHPGWGHERRPDGSERLSCQGNDELEQLCGDAFAATFDARRALSALEPDYERLTTGWPFPGLREVSLTDGAEGSWLARTARNEVVSASVYGLHLPGVGLEEARELLPHLEGTQDARCERVVVLGRELRATWEGRSLSALVSSYWSVQSLATWRGSRNNIGLNQLIALFSDIAEGLAFYHDLGFTFDDLCPERVLVKLEGGVFRARLDVPSWALGRSVQEDARCYLFDSGESSPRADQRALLVLLLYLIYGELPEPLANADGSGLAPDVLDVAEQKRLVEDTDSRWYRELRELLEKCWKSPKVAPERIADAFARITEDVIPTIVVDPGPSTRHSSHSAVDTTELPPEEAPRDEGYTLGNVTLHEKLATGGFADVYLGYHNKMHTEVAVKVLSKRGMEQEASVVDRFVNEALLCAKIDSPHLVRVYEVNEDKGLHFLVMEFIDGWTAHSILAKIVQKGYKGLTENLCLCIGEACARGLGDLHRHNVIHRDVKPANIMIPKTAGNRPDVLAAKLIDLGLAKEPQLGLTTTGVSFGTLGFMPPEQVDDAKDVVPATDVFGLAATMYQLLTARQPFEGETPADIVASTMDGTYIPVEEVRPDVSHATCQMIATALATHPADRYRDGYEMFEVLRGIRNQLRRSRK